jgi:hypothetical protein
MSEMDQRKNIEDSKQYKPLALILEIIAMPSPDKEVFRAPEFLIISSK